MYKKCKCQRGLRRYLDYFRCGGNKTLRKKIIFESLDPLKFHFRKKHLIEVLLTLYCIHAYAEMYISSRRVLLNRWNSVDEMLEIRYVLSPNPVLSMSG